jgi:hypothetical protein
MNSNSDLYSTDVLWTSRGLPQRAAKAKAEASIIQVLANDKPLFEEKSLLAKLKSNSHSATCKTNNRSKPSTINQDQTTNSEQRKRKFIGEKNNKEKKKKKRVVGTKQHIGNIKRSHNNPHQGP